MEESNDLAIENKDKVASTYDTQAKGVASIILKYVSISPRFDELAKDFEIKGIKPQGRALDPKSAAEPRGINPFDPSSLAHHERGADRINDRHL